MLHAIVNAEMFTLMTLCQVDLIVLVFTCYAHTYVIDTMLDRILHIELPRLSTSDIGARPADMPRPEEDKLTGRRCAPQCTERSVQCPAFPQIIHENTEHSLDNTCNDGKTSTIFQYSSSPATRLRVHETV